MPFGIPILTEWRAIEYAEIVKDAISEKRGSAGRGAVRFKGRGLSLGVTAASTNELISQIERGFSFQSLRTLESHSGMSVSTIASLIGIPERTLARRRAAGRLNSEESERLLRLASIFEKAVELFEGDVVKAMEWLVRPQKSLGRTAPLAYARTEPGAREVENLIGRLEHGVFS